MIPITDGPTIDCDCGSVAVWQDKSDDVYQKDYGPIYLCHDCGAYVGVHKVGSKPWYNALGTPADAELRALRRLVHSHIDPFWKDGKYKRKTVYARLAKALDIPQSECHVAMFDKDMCRTVLTFFKGDK